MMWVPAQQTSALRGGSVSLTCFVEAHPEALTFWEHNGSMMQPGPRVTIRNKQGNPTYKVRREFTLVEMNVCSYESFKVYLVRENAGQLAFDTFAANSQ